MSGVKTTRHEARRKGDRLQGGKELNSVVYRKHAHLKLSKKYKNLLNLPYFKNNHTVLNIEHISKGDTGTQAHVFRYYVSDTNPPMHLVTKITVINENTRQEDNDVVKAEKEFYKLANFMVNKVVCPFFLRSIPRLTSKKGTSTVKSSHILNMMGIPLNDASKDVDAHILTTETYDASRVKPLFEFLSENNLSDDEVDVMIFQFAYTFSCMNKIGWRHNDIHFDNVLALSVPQFIKQNRIFEVLETNRSMVAKPIRFLIPYTRVDIRIFDFDLSVKVEAPVRAPLSCMPTAIRKGKPKEFKALQKLNIKDTYYNFNPCYDFVSAMCELKKFYPQHRFFQETGVFDCDGSKYARMTHRLQSDELPRVFFPENVLSSNYFERFRYTAKRNTATTEVFSQSQLYCK